MKNCFVLREVGAIADLVPFEEGMLVTRINVPRVHRKRGYGTQLLKNILAEADRTGTKLYLLAVATGGLEQEELEAWYKRYGFEEDMGVLTRTPRKVDDEHYSSDPDSRGCDPISSYSEYEQEGSPPREGPIEEAV